MKEKTKFFLKLLGVWHFATFLRSLPEIKKYKKEGFSGPAPYPVKMRIVRNYVTKYNLKLFVETGTYLGITLRFIADLGIRCISIELSEKLYEMAQDQFKPYNNVTLIQGDSGVKIKEVLRTLNEPALFWLDGHYSEGITSTTDVHSPISAELEAVLNHPIRQHVILIDDAKYFTGKNGYPHLDQLLKVVRENGRYHSEVSTDIIRLLPIY